MKQIFLLIAISFAYCSKLDFVSKKQTRSLNNVELNFSSASGMTFSENKWSFTINFWTSNTALEENKDYTISLLYNDSPNLAKCKMESDSLLKCIFEQNGQTKLDLIRLNNDANNADIKWENLDGIYDIPIQCSLRYINAFNLTYNTESDHSFIVEIENNSLPEKAFVKMDIYYKEKNMNATCYHSNSLLKCNFFSQDSSTNPDWRAKILPQKNIGTIEWLNLNTNSEIYIPVIVTLSGYYYWEPKFSYAYSRNLTLIDNKWHFILRSTYFNNGIY